MVGLGWVLYPMSMGLSTFRGAGAAHMSAVQPFCAPRGCQAGVRAKRAGRHLVHCVHVGAILEQRLDFVGAALFGCLDERLPGRVGRH